MTCKQCGLEKDKVEEAITGELRKVSKSIRVAYNALDEIQTLTRGDALAGRLAGSLMQDIMAFQRKLRRFRAGGHR